MIDELNPLIHLEQCTVSSHTNVLLENISWTVLSGETWLLTGSNGSGKSALIAALAGELNLETFSKDKSNLNKRIPTRIARASFEEASRLLKEEREHDDSEFIEGGIDPGRTPAILLNILNPEKNPIVMRCGIVSILNRGLKYLSTGEIRRTLLARALLDNAPLLVLDEPFEGLDTDARETLGHIIDEITSDPKRTLILVQDRLSKITPHIDKVLYLESRNSTFTGTTKEFDYYRARRKIFKKENQMSLKLLPERTDSDSNNSKESKAQKPLVEMNNVSVGWSDTVVLDNITWKLFPGEHCLIRGPNASGKTTFLELITGDNTQVFKNDVRLFGKRRGSGETIWEIKAQMGIVSWRLHQEYRLTGDLDIEGVLLSGLHDSIGLYQSRTNSQRQIAGKWLKLAQLDDRKGVSFNALSYGEQRAVLILRAAIKRPALLILDEPCHGLDEEYRTFVLNLLEKIANTGSTTLLHVTHDPTEKLACEKTILEFRPGENPMWVTLKA